MFRKFYKTKYINLDMQQAILFVKEKGTDIINNQAVP
jgi:hypothetical protein